MARETKQERVVRAMLDQVTEHLHDLKNLEGSPATKELDVERWCQSVLRTCLGFTASAGYQIRAQESKGKMRPDLIVMQNEKPIFVVEVKRLGFDLNKSDFRSGKVQLKEYLHSIGDVRWGFLSNGFEWKLFDFSNPQVGGIEVCSFDLKGESETIDTSKKNCEEVAWTLFDIHEASFASNAWDELSREATAFSPESLAKAILSADVVKYVARAIRGEHEYKANIEVLTDRIFDLLENGLDDSIPGWNDVRAAELQKYVKAQKRASRRSKRSPKPPADQNGKTAIAVEADVQAGSTTPPVEAGGDKVAS